MLPLSNSVKTRWKKVGLDHVVDRLAHECRASNNFWSATKGRTRPMRYLFYASNLHSMSPTSTCMCPSIAGSDTPIAFSPQHTHPAAQREKASTQSWPGQTRRVLPPGMLLGLGKSRRGPLFLILSCVHVKKKKKQPFFCCYFSWGSTTVHTNYHPHFRAGPVFLVSHSHSAVPPDHRKATTSQSDRLSRSTAATEQQQLLEHSEYRRIDLDVSLPSPAIRLQIRPAL